MLWPFALPFKITFWLFAAIIISISLVAPLLKMKRGEVFFVSTILAILAFIPSCTSIMYLVDEMRFGNFEYASFADVQDFRAERYLPTTASKIKMHKHENGYRAQYSISEADFYAFIDGMWKEFGEHSVHKRAERSSEGASVSRDEFERVFGDLGWQPPDHAIEYYSPTEADGGGATYYFAAEQGVAYQRTGYW